MSIQLVNISKKFGDFAALDRVSLTVPKGNLTALLGPSGSGKTTLLRIIAGLEAPDSGEIFFSGKDTTRRSAAERRVGFVFQHYALFRHMSVFENVAFGLRVKPRDKRPSNEVITAKVTELLKLVQLDRMAHHRPSQLSGGQRQRVALARALAVRPEILLLDEPFGALDAKVRQELRRWLRRLHDEIGLTSVFVTHDQEEALEVADTVVILQNGRIEQMGTPEEVYERPATPFVYHFLGNVNLFHGRVEGGTAHMGEFSVEVPPEMQESPVAAYARPHLLDLSHEKPEGRPHFKARVTHVNPAGALVKIELTTAAGDPVHAELSRERYAELGVKKGLEMYVSLKDVKIFKKPQDNRGAGI